jgi:hypothetical protein
MISPTCEVGRACANWLDDYERGVCDEPTSYVYPTDSGNWMALCSKHAQNHSAIVISVEQAISQGEVFEGAFST